MLNRSVTNRVGALEFNKYFSAPSVSSAVKKNPFSKSYLEVVLKTSGRSTASR